MRRGVQRGVQRSQATARRVRTWSQTVPGRLWLAFSGTLGIVILIFALVGVPHVFRGVPLHYVVDLDASKSIAPPSPEFRRAMQLATHTALLPGATVELLNDGAIFPRLFADLRAAQRSITMVSYYGVPGNVADTLAVILEERARAGIPVYWVHDAVGSSDLPPRYFASIRAAGAHIAVFRPLRWYTLDRLNHRSHVRAVVIDGAIGYTGGFGFGDTWLGDGHDEGQWRDTNVRVTGPPVPQLQQAFIAHWAEAAHELLAGEALLPPVMAAATARAAADTTGQSPSQESEGRPELAGAMSSPAGVGSSVASRLMALSLAAAQHTLFITNAYFAPDADYLRMLREAKARGVDVRVLTNGEKSDVQLSWLAGRRRYEDLLRGGVRIYEYQPTVLHPKTLVVDGIWSAVGTVNFDNRSLAFNDEMSMLVLDPRFGAQMDSLFRHDLQYATEIQLAEFQRRSWTERVLEFGADLLWRWL